jgi:transitional endoplasmic reticulum ATPase
MLLLIVKEARAEDTGRGIARVDPSDIRRLGGRIGDVVEIAGKRTSVAKLMPLYKEDRGQSCVQLDNLCRHNTGMSQDEQVMMRLVKSEAADKITLAPLGNSPNKRDLDYIGNSLDGLPVLKGDQIMISLPGQQRLDFTIEHTAPSGPVLVNPLTSLVISGANKSSKQTKPAHNETDTAYENIGGLKRQLYRIREMIELPLLYPEVFEKLGIEAPKGVLLHGPPGCGKTLIARAIAKESQAQFYTINGPEIIHKFYGESEGHLRKIFEQAAQKGPSIIFIDEIDAIAPQRERVVGDVEKRVVAQLLALMDGLNRRQNVIVIAATNLPHALDPALRRPGRFDREISIPIPDKYGRLEIMKIHSRSMPLTKDVDITQLAAITHGFVGADLEALCREAAMNCLRRTATSIDFTQARISHSQLAMLEVCMEDFLSALREIEPSAIREVFVEIPEVRWQDIGGHEDIKLRLKEAIEWPLRYPQVFERVGLQPPKGVLLGGPSGCGKTLLAKALAHESEINFISVKGPELLSKYVGESERGVRDVFRKARQAAPCIIFFDEIDALLPSRSQHSSDGHVGERVLGQFLVEMDGLEELKGVLVLGATNRIDLLDPALLRPGRFDEIVEIPTPDRNARRAIFDVHLRNKPVAKTIDLDQLIEQTEGWNGAEIASICHRAALSALRQAVEKCDNTLDTQGTSPDSLVEKFANLPIQIDMAHLQQSLVTIQRTKEITKRT